MFRSVFVAVVLLALPAGAAPAQDTPEAIVDRIRELQREIDELLARLPPELREEVRRSLAEPPPEAPVEPPPPEPEKEPPPTPPPRRSRTSCNTLAAFDTNEDGAVDARDRYWRYLYLWLDRNGNGQMEEREIVSPFDKKVLEIAADLEGFSGGKGLYGEIRRGERLVLDLKGDGFGGGRDDGVLLVDAGALARGGGPQLLSAAGEEIEGIQPFQRGWRLRDADGTVTRLNCP